jgi:hypothetical protein
LAQYAKPFLRLWGNFVTVNRNDLFKQIKLNKPMKKLIMLNIICLGLAGMSFTDPFDTKEFLGIYGEWNTQFNDGQSYHIHFYPDGTYSNEITMNDDFPNGKYKDLANWKSTSSGVYSMKGDTLLISSNHNCIDVEGKYKIIFKENETVRLSVIKDACENRMATFDDMELWRK